MFRQLLYMLKNMQYRFIIAVYIVIFRKLKSLFAYADHRAGSNGKISYSVD